MSSPCLQILSRKNTYDAAIPELVLSDISDKPPELLEDPQFRAFTGTAVPENDPVMVPFTEPIISPVPGVQITAMGFLDDKLHIQTHFDNILEYDNHGFVYLTDADGTQISSVGSISFWDASHSGSYEEFLFDIPSDELTSYTVSGYFVTCDTLIQGNWQITIPLK